MNQRAWPIDSVPELAVGGDGRHGVVRFARDVERAVRAVTDAPADGRLHLHFTDHLFGGPEVAAAQMEALDRPFTVTLHDIPQASDGPRNQARRTACYRRVAAAARGVVVCSQHEARLLGMAATVIPHPIDPDPQPRLAPDDEIVVLGHVYPGKGHAEVIDAAAGTSLGVTALGAPSAGHEDDLRAMHERAAARGVRFTVSGWVPDDALRERLGRARVPVIAHQHVSASGSLATWVAAGRRPLAIANAYTREMAALRHGTLSLVDDLAAALADPPDTWQGPDADTGPDSRAFAAAHIRFWEDTAWP